MIFMQQGMDFCSLGLWFSFYFVRRREQPFMGLLFFSFLFLSFPFSFFPNTDCWTHTVSFSWEALELELWGPNGRKKKKGKEKSKVYMDGFSRPSRWKEVEREDQAWSTNDDDNDVVSVRFFFSVFGFISLIIYLFLFFLAPTHDDLGCQGQARRKSISSTLLLEGLPWMTPAN